MSARGRGDIFFIDSPVSGGAKRAADGTLSIMAGATDAALEKGKFLLQEMSDASKLYLVPGGIGAGSNMKMVHQVLAGIHILGASEAMGFAARLGLDARAAADAIIQSDAWTWMHENRLQRMLEEDWNPGASALTIILKDVVCTFSWEIFRTTVIADCRKGYHHIHRTPSQIPSSALIHCRTNLPHRPSVRLGSARRLCHGPHVLPRSYRQSPII